MSQRQWSGRHRRKKTLSPHLNAPTIMGVAALAVAAVGGLSVPDATGNARTAFAAAAPSMSAEQASALSSTALHEEAIRDRAALASSAAKIKVAKAQERAEAAALARKLAAERARAVAAARASRQRAAAANAWVKPTTGYRLTARFGASGGRWSNGHTGLDFAAPNGTRVVAVRAGKVTFASTDGPYGKKIEITHADGTQTWYAHLSAITVDAGASVGAGEAIGRVGSTGNSSGPHLHLEVRIADQPVDPQSYLRRKGLSV